MHLISSFLQVFELFFSEKHKWCKFYFFCQNISILFFMFGDKFSYIYIQQIWVMKIVLKHDHEVKLYTEELDFEHILEFINSQFQLSKESLSMTYHDLQGDNITILTNQDFQIMQSILDGKQYVKINLEGTKIENTLQNDKLITIYQFQQQKQEVRHLKIQQKQNSTQINCIKVPFGNKVDSNQSRNQIQREQKSHLKDKKETFCKTRNFLNQMVANLVDERIKSLLPCLKQQLKNKNSQETELKSINSMIHQRVECKGCSAIPIVGIRYKCLKCPNYNLCEVCENKIQHQHNLLKIKRIQAEKESQQHGCMRQLFKGCGRSLVEQKRQKCRRWGGHHFNTKLAGLSFIFGGEPQSYRSYVEGNENLYPRQTFMAYAKSIGMHQEMFRKKFVEWRCHKLSSCFGKNAQNYTSFVEENYDLKYREIIQLLYEKGLQKRRQQKSCYKGKYFNFNEFNQEVKKCEPKDYNCRRQNFQFKENKQVQQKMKVTESILQQSKPQDIPQVSQAKGNIFKNIKLFFPDAENKEIYKFVEEHYKKDNEQEVIQLWAQRCFGK